MFLSLFLIQAGKNAFALCQWVSTLKPTGWKEHHKSCRRPTQIHIHSVNNTDDTFVHLKDIEHQFLGATQYNPLR